MSILAVAIGLYPLIYLSVDKRFGLLSTKSEALLADIMWNTGFYIHITCGGLALLVGWTQFIKTIRIKHVKWHRLLGKTYVVSVLLGSIAGFYIAFFATGGWVAQLGFVCLAVIWFLTTMFAYAHIRNNRVEQHRVAMIYSYAACFAAVTLRLWIPILVPVFGDFVKAYVLIAWLCWVPNLFVGYLLTRRYKLSIA
jgi:uncharacterized membrane protein